MNATAKVRITDAEAHFWLTVRRRQLKDKIAMLKREAGPRGILRPRSLKWLTNSMAELEAVEEEMESLIVRSPQFEGKTYDRV